MIDNTFALSKDTLMKQSAVQMDAHLQTGDYTLAQRVALTCRILFDSGHDSGLAGQITARTEQPGTFFTQRLGLGFNEISEDNLLVVDEHLTVVSGEGMANPANRFHAWVYRARPDVKCIIHTHAIHTAALGMLEVPLEISHMDNCVLYDDVAFVDHWPGVPVGNEEGELISTALGDKHALLLSHHGLLIAAGTVEEACVMAIAFERAARMHLLAAAAGTIKPIDPALGREAREWLAHPKRSAVTFAHYARRALREERNVDCIRIKPSRSPA